jgi:hypothetical protein
MEVSSGGPAALPEAVKLASGPSGRAAILASTDVVGGSLLRIQAQLDDRSTVAVGDNDLFAETISEAAATLGNAKENGQPARLRPSGRAAIRAANARSRGFKRGLGSGVFHQSLPVEASWNRTVAVLLCRSLPGLVS